MRPDDANGRRAPEDRPVRLLVVAGCYEKGSWTQPDLMWNLDLYARLDLADAFAKHVVAKGRVQPGEYRAFGYRPPLRD